jgi:WD40 repeat protein
MAVVRRRLQGRTDEVMCVSMSPDERFFVSGGRNKNIRVWEIATGRQVKVLEGHSDWVNSVLWSRDGQYIVSGSDDQTLRVWELDEMVRFAVHVYVRLS